MPYTNADFVETFKEFTSKSPDAITEALTLAESETDASLWGLRYKRAVFLLAAHELSMTPNARTAVPIHLNRGSGTKTLADKGNRISRPYLEERTELEARLILGATVA